MEKQVLKNLKTTQNYYRSIHTYFLMQAEVKNKMNSVLSIFAQVEHDKASQTVQVINVMKKESRPRKPAEIAGLSGLKQPTVRRIIATLVKLGTVKRHPNNRYSIIK